MQIPSKILDVSHIKLNLIKNCKIAVFGFGAQGKAQALNLKDSGLDIIIALRESSKHIEEALSQGFTQVLSFAEAAKKADVIMLLTPDETHSELFQKYIKPNFKKGGTIIVAHGFSFHFGYMKGYEEYNIGMVAPKAVGKAVRKNFLEKLGIFSLIAKFHEVDVNLEQILTELAVAIGSIKILETTFKIECETDLFGEQTVLCGGVISLFKNAFDVLVEAGYPPLIAYYECVHELKLILDLVYEKGVPSMFNSISTTAKFGGQQVGDFLIDESVKGRMKEVLHNIQTGKFAKTFMEQKNIVAEQKALELEGGGEIFQDAGEDVLNILKK